MGKDEKEEEEKYGKIFGCIGWKMKRMKMKQITHSPMYHVHIVHSYTIPNTKSEFAVRHMA